MSHFNPFGLAIMLVIMIPNVIFAYKHKDGFANAWHNRLVEVLEQIGRFACFALMVFNIPYTYFGFFFVNAKAVYFIVCCILVIVYCTVWVVCFNRSSLLRALALSIIPSVLFMFCGVMLVSIPLIVAATVFAPCHILISCKNTEEQKK